MSEKECTAASSTTSASPPSATTANVLALSSFFSSFLNNNNNNNNKPMSTSKTPTASSSLQQRLSRNLADLHLHRDPIYIWSSLVAGFGSGALASILCAPLDLIRTRLQVWGEVMGKGSGGGTLKLVPMMLRDIIKKDGFIGLFRGLGATLMTVPVFWGVYFPLYDDLKRHWTIQYPHLSQVWIHMGAAVSAGAVSDVLCNPMFVVRTRLQTESMHILMEGLADQNKKSVIETARALYQEGGAPIFWRGMTANLLGLSHVAVQFPVYESLKKTLRKRRHGDGHHHHHQQHSAWDLLAASALSKMTACVMTYPHEVIRARMMDARAGATRVSFVDTCRRIYVAEGMAGFYAGLPITMLRVLPNTCITFAAYELLLQWARKQIEENRGSGRPTSR